MPESPSFTKKSFFSFFIVFLVLSALFCSCSNNAPQIANAKLSIIFDYDSYEELPEARLSVFVEAISNPRRFESIYVSSNKNELVWESSNLIMAENKETKYCGITNMVMPQKEEIPSGEYTISYRQADEEEKEIKAYLNYNKELYKTVGEQAAEIMKKNAASRMLIVYDQEKNIIYYGPRSQDFSTARGIWNTYPQAAEFQESWVSSNGSLICNMPLEKVLPGN